MRDLLRKYGVQAVVLIAFVVTSSGCATYSRIEVTDPDSSGHPIDFDARLFEGDPVRGVLNSGEKFEGILVEVSETKLVVDGFGNYGESQYKLVASEIAYIEVRDQSGGQIEGGWFLLLGVAAVTGFLTMDWGMN